MKKIFYSGLWMMAFAVILTMFSMIVSAEYVCDNYEQDQLSYCIGATTFSQQWEDFSCYKYDFNVDGIINLQDVSSYASMCEETITETIPETIEPVKEVTKKKSSSYHYVRQEDGSLTFRSVGTAIQYPNTNMIITWDRNTVGTTCWNYEGISYCGTFYDQYGYEIVNIKVRG